MKSMGRIQNRGEAPAPMPSSLQPQAACGAQPQASTERARIAPEGLGLDGRELSYAAGNAGGRESHPRRMPRGERLELLALGLSDRRGCLSAKHEVDGFHLRQDRRRARLSDGDCLTVKQGSPFNSGARLTDKHRWTASRVSEGW